MRDMLKRYNVNCLWHFTDKRNIASIKQYGLLSWGELKRRGLVPAVPGGNQWSHDADAYSGLENYVHLSFNKNNPMLYIATKEGRIVDPVWLSIDLSVIDENTLYTSDVSNKANVQRLDNISALKEIDFEALFKYLDFKIDGNAQRKKAAVKSEILVPAMIDLNKIKGL